MNKRFYLFCLLFPFSFLFAQEIDNSFAQNGLAQSILGDAYMDGTAIAVQADGYILVGAYQSNYVRHRYLDGQFGDSWWVTRLDPNGKVDTTFADHGELMITSTGNERSFRHILLDKEGRILLAGGKGAKFIFIRLMPDGRPDLSFGQNGKVEMQPEPGSRDLTELKEVYIADDGTIFFLGRFSEFPGIFKSMLGKIKSNGQPDPAFGTEGLLLTPSPYIENSLGLCIQENKYLVLAGQSGAGRFFMRLDLNGNLDESFGNGGIQEYTVSVIPNIFQLQWDGGEGLLVSKALQSEMIRDNNPISRFQLSGKRDTAFDSNFPQFMWDYFLTTVSTVQGDAGKSYILYDITGDRSLFMQPNPTPFIRQACILKLDSTGRPDRHFGFQGFSIFRFEGRIFEATGMCLQSDGKLLIIGTSENDIGIIRVLPDGTLDGELNGLGLRRLNSDRGWSSSFCVTTDPQGNIWAGGTVGESLEEMDHTLLRSQFLVTSLDDKGKPRLGLQEEGQFAHRVQVGFEGIYDMQWGEDGFLYMLGESSISYFISRFLPEGILDASFGDNGVTAYSPVNSQYRALNPNFIIQPDGKILLSAPFFGSSATRMSLVRLNSDGSPDEDFSGAGRLILLVGEDEKIPSQVQLLLDGRMRLIGISRKRNGDPWQLTMMQIRTDNALDKSFGKKGTIVHNMILDHAIIQTALLPDGKMLLMGTSQDRFALYRFLPNGYLDKSFGWEGEVNTDFVGKRAMAHDMEVFPDGRILITGSVTDATDDNQDLAFACFDSEGKLDRNFGEDGRFVLDLGNAQDAAYNLHRDAEGRLLVAGSSGYQQFVLRLLPKLEFPTEPSPSTMANPWVYPNPIRETTTLRFQLFQPEQIKIELLDLQGRLVHSFQHETKESGWHEELLEIPANVLPGHYLIGFTGSESTTFVKVIINK